jgi:hypothetical protein
MIQLQSILAALDMMMLCIDGGLRARWDSLTVSQLYAFGILERLAHVVLATESDNFRQLRML